MQKRIQTEGWMGNFLVVVEPIIKEGKGRGRGKKEKKGKRRREKERKKGRGEGRTSENVNRSFVIDGVPYSIDYRL